jgi:DnaJ-class molecular chaperone
MQTPPIDCAFCQGTGKQLSGETWIKLDVHNRPIPCPICKGKGKVKL